MKTYDLRTEQFLDITLEDAWNFFSSPLNLSRITPPDMDFSMHTNLTIESIREGMVIDYTVHPLFRIPVRWKTLICEVKELHHFTDKQLIGPYRLWEHTHTFTEKNGKVLMSDHVKYILPFGVAGRLIHRILIKKRIQEIFNFRRQTLHDLFNKNDNPAQ